MAFVMKKATEVKRVHVVKRQGFDVEASGLAHDLKENLGLTGLQSVRIFNRYDVSGLGDDSFEMAVRHVFSEASVDDVIYDNPDLSTAAAVVAVEALPGQYDQRADSAAQCVQILTQGERPLCRTARVYAFYGRLNQSEIELVKGWLINPVESREASIKKPDSLEDQLEMPPMITQVEDLTNFDDDQLDQLRIEAGLAMSLSDLKFIREYFRTEQRDPSWTELRVLDTYWSDHCRHTTFLTRIDEVNFEDDAMSSHMQAVLADYESERKILYGDKIEQKPFCLMDLATLAMKLLRKAGKLNDLDESEEINACSIKVSVDVNGTNQDYLVMFKNETHNHPTEIEPFGGAATCLGGAIRDPLSGRSYVYQAMRVTGSGDPTVPVSDTLPGKLPQRKLTRTAANGYSSYGNQIGLATGQVEEIYHEGYLAKRMEIGAVIAAAPAEFFRWELRGVG
jgi:phosphoribosylformylglycinamidine synthase